MNKYFNGSGTIGFTCDNCGRETHGCTWVNGMSFCAKCYQETFGETDKDKRIADLEEKLAESEKKPNQYPYKNDVIEKQYEDLKDGIKFRIENNIIDDWEQLYHCIDVLCEKHKARIRDIENGISVIEQLKQQLAEKDKMIEEINKEFVQSIHDWKEIIEKKEQAKTDFAIEKLEKVKNYLKDRLKIIEGDECIYDIDEIVAASCENKKTLEIIDQQIKELTEKK